MHAIKLQDDLQVSKLNFLEEVANKYYFFGKQRDVFLNRFAWDNAASTNKVLAESMWSHEEIFHRQQTFQDHLTNICKVLAKDGCPIKSHKRGQPQKGESPWEQAFKWLWEMKFPQWQAQKNSAPYSSFLSTAPINWREVCHRVLAKQKENQRLRRKATERGFELDIYVPLGLVERKQQQRRSGEVPLAQVYQLDKEVVTKEYQHDDFLNGVIGQSQNSKSKYIAITGEPGSGKTTLLGEIAAELQKNDKGLPIYISLSGLQGKKLKEYLLQKWLEAALPFIDSEAVRVTSVMEDELIKQFRQGKVWLLLDAVDEMGAASSVEALALIQAQLVDWLASARVVLTCCLNIWDASVNNTLTGFFKTYKTLEFTDNQVQEFIGQWFEAASGQETIAELKLQTQLLGEQLQTKLKEVGRVRLRELVKNPLRLSLLCQTFYLDKSGELPNTKAKLYSRFVRYFYEWEQKEYEQKHEKITWNQRQKLNEALGKLALAGLNDAARYRLLESLACEEMGELLFNLACKLGWLNLVDREAETDEPIYAFFHPTFQEYFAARGIENWDYFLPRKHDNNNPKPVEGSIYRIFEPQWKEIILLWLGREDVSNWRKNELLDTLVEFRDGCNDFYQYQAYFIATAGIAEFWDYSRANETMRQLLKWSFGSPFHVEQQKGQIAFQFEESISLSLIERSSAALRETERSRAIKFLTERLHSIKNLELYLRDIQNHEQIDTAARNTINFLARKLLEQRTRVAYNLGKIDPTNQEAINALTDAIHTLTEGLPTSQETLTHLDVLRAGFCLLTACMLLEISPSNPNAVDAINHLTQLLGVSFSNADIVTVFPLLMNFSLTEPERWQYACNSIYIVPAQRDIHQQNHIDLEELIAKISLQITLSDTSETIVLTGVTGQTSIVEFLHTCKDKNALCLTVFMFAFRAREICAGNFDIAKALIYLLRTHQDSAVRLQVTHGLKAILTENLLPTVVAALKDCLQDSVGKNDWDLYKHCEAVIWHCAQNMAYPHFYHAWHGAPSPVQALENQFLNLRSQLQLTDKIYLLWINVQSLEREMDTSAIAQEILNQIFFAAFPDTSGIPLVNNAAQLRSKIPQIKRQLQKQDLALILHRYEPYPKLVSFCRQLASDNVIHIGWITAKPLEAPLRGFSPAQSNLANALQNWINEIG